MTQSRALLLGLTLSTLLAAAIGQDCPTPPVVAHQSLVAACSVAPASSAIGCSMYALCSNSSLAPPIFSALCDNWRIASSLCGDDAAVVASASGLCGGLLAAYPSEAQFRSCLRPYGGINSTAAVLASTRQACDDMAGEFMEGCDACTASACPNPLVSYANGCIDMDMGQCAAWRTFCGGDAAPAGAAAAMLCRRPGAARDSVVAPPRPPSPPPSSPPPSPSPPPPPSATLSSPPPPTAATGGSSPSPTPSPSPAAQLPSPLPSPSLQTEVIASPSPSPAPSGGMGGSVPPAAPCIADGSLPLCVGYSYPDANVAADLMNLCAAMPYMPGCTVRAACQAGLVTGDFCRPMTLLATICLDMPSMGGCKSYRTLCRNTTVVEQCANFPAIPGLPTTKEAQASVDAMCSSMYMTQCDSCNEVSCADYIGAMSSMCTEMPYMDGCPTYAAWCQATAGWEGAASSGDGSSSSMSFFCSGSSVYGGSSGSDIPSMLMYFHQRTRELLLFKEWMPRTVGQAVGSFIAIAAMGFVAVGLRTVNGILHTAAAAGRLGARLAPGSHPGGPWWVPSGSQAALNLLSAVLSLLVTTLDLFTMLIAMTFNGAYFAAVVLGYALGTLLLGHLKDNYARHLGVEVTPAAAGGGGGSELGQGCCGGGVSGESEAAAAYGSTGGKGYGKVAAGMEEEGKGGSQHGYPAHRENGNGNGHGNGNGNGHGGYGVDGTSRV